MSDKPEVTYVEIDEDANPSATFKFEKDGAKAEVTVSLSFGGEWMKFYLGGNAAEGEVRHEFALGLFELITHALS